MIITAAIIIDGEVESLPRPNRHHNILRKFPRSNFMQGTQGFIDDERGFVGRKLAAKIALEEGQIKNLKYSKYLLFSEDLW